MRIPGWVWTVLVLVCLFNLDKLDLNLLSPEETRRLAKRLQHLPRRPPDPDVVILGIDDEVFKSGRFNRPQHAQVIDTLTRAGVRSIFFDVIFDEPRGPELDKPLAEAIGRSGRVIVAGFYQIDEQQAKVDLVRPQFYPELNQLIERGDCRVGIINTSRKGHKDQADLAFHDHGDGERIRLGGAAALLADHYHLGESDVEVVPANFWRGKLLNIPPLSLEVTSTSQAGVDVLLAPIHYHPPATGPQGQPGAPGRIKVVPYLKVADQDPATLAEMQGKFVLIGENTTGNDDVYDTPVGRMKGVEIHAQVFDALLHGATPRVPLPGTALMHQAQILIAILCLSLGVLLKRQPSLYRYVLLMIATLLCWEFMVVQADRRYYFLPQTLGEASIFLTGVVAMLLRFLSTHRVLRTFVPAAIAEQLIRDEEIHQGAVHATVMVTDIRGYTTLSESRTPTQVLDLLNDYHGETVALYQKYGGHVLNYQGDAQIILFGHPKKLKDAARQAILAAQAASSAVERLRRRWKLPPDQAFNVGAGICTGKVIIADLGGEHREYTVIGELVRKCHKLQSQSQVLGANIILDEETYEVCKTKPTVEKRENVVIDGLPEPVTVYITDIVTR